ncbi:WhiB family transcriptional regulator [Candidatus Saccharibacteria bacterium]|nr:WhiB family transcriptional regulator [Candidatus Saccharibacteria bacterium]
MTVLFDTDPRYPGYEFSNLDPTLEFDHLAREVQDNLCSYLDSTSPQQRSLCLVNIESAIGLMLEMLDDHESLRQVLKELCRHMPELMFVPEFEHRLIDLGKRVCGNCVMLTWCQDYALGNPDIADDGIWAGKTASERSQAASISANAS